MEFTLEKKGGTIWKKNLFSNQKLWQESILYRLCVQAIFTLCDFFVQVVDNLLSLFSVVQRSDLSRKWLCATNIGTQTFSSIDKTIITGRNIYQQYTHTLKPWYNEPRYSEFRDIVNKTQLPFWGFTKHITFDIVNYSI